MTTADVSRLVLVAASGLILGSFLNVLIYRLPRQLSILGTRSKCPHCRGTIAWHDNVPVVSYLLIGGKCRQCHGVISRRYPAVEILAMLLAVACALRFASIPELVFAALFTFGLLVAAATDLEGGVVPDLIAVLLVVVGFGRSWMYADFLGLAVGVVVGGGVLLTVAAAYRFVRKRPGLGLGDVKLMAGIGACLGWEGALHTLFVGSVAALLVVAPLLAIGRVHPTTRIPFAPFLGLGALVRLFLG